MLFSPIVGLAICLGLFLTVEAQTDATDAVSFLVENSEAVGIKLPGYIKLLTSKRSSFLSRLLHYVFGARLERAATNLMTKASQTMPEEASIEGIENLSGMTLKHGMVTGLRDISVTSNGQVNIIFDNGYPAFIVPIHFKKLKISFKFSQDLKVTTKSGVASASVEWNNIVLKFRLTLNPIERCYLNLYDVVFTDMEDLDFSVESTEGISPTGGYLTSLVMDAFFSATDSEVEEHIKKAIADVMYYEIPVASAAICDNKKRSFMMSHYQTEHKKRQEQTDKVQQIIKKQNSVQSKQK